MPSRRVVLAGLGGCAGMSVTTAAGQSTVGPMATWMRTYAPDSPETSLISAVVSLSDGAVLVGLAGELNRYRGWVARVGAGGRV